MAVEKSLKGAEAIFLALLVIGLMGLLFLIIYGNLSDNLGWVQESETYYNETINLSGTGNTPASAIGKLDGSLSSVLITNATSGLTVTSGNYTITEIVINASNTGVSFYAENVNVSYTVTFNNDGQVNTDNVISNLTDGATQFFTFSNVWFILTAIAILIAIVLGVITLVRKAGNGGMSSGNKSANQFAS